MLGAEIVYTLHWIRKISAQQINLPETVSNNVGSVAILSAGITWEITRIPSISNKHDW